MMVGRQNKRIEKFAFETCLHENYESWWMKHEEVMSILHLVPETDCLTLLDLGTGTGAWGIRLANRGFAVVGVDLSLTEIKNARQNACLFGQRRGSFDVVNADVEHLPFRANTFHISFCGGILHHLPNPRLTILELTRVVAGNRIIAFEPNGQNPYRRAVRRLMRLMSNWTLQKGFSSPNETLHEIKSYVRIFRTTQFADVWYRSVRWPRIGHSNVFQFLDTCIRNATWILLPRSCGGDNTLIVAARGRAR